MDRFQAMSIFVAVAESGSFAQAAQQFDVSPPAVTRSIAALEKRLGALLLHRTTRRVGLTEIGAQYLGDCRRILAELQEAEDSANGSFRAPRGVLHVTAPVLFGQLFVLPALLDFLDRYPAVQGRTFFVDRIVNMLEEGLDVAIRIGELADSALIATRVGTIRRVVCASPAYLQSRDPLLNPKDLQGHRLVVASPVSSAGQWDFQEQGSALPVSISPALVVNTNAAAIQAATKGWGLTRVLSYQVAQELARGELQLVLCDFEPAPWPIYILHQEGRKVSAKVRAFVDFLARRLKEHPDLISGGPVQSLL